MRGVCVAVGCCAGGEGNNYDRRMFNCNVDRLCMSAYVCVCVCGGGGDMFA